MSDIRELFRPESNIFTVFVVEQRFVMGRGHEYFRSYINTSNFFDSDEKIKKRFRKIIESIEKSVAPVSSLVSVFSPGLQITSITDVITSLCKLFTVHEHQAAGPDVIDPIILQEGKITRRALTKLIHLNKDSILSPSIIILLKDNDFERAKKLLSECPDGINVKMIRNSGEEEIHKIVNCGAEDVDSFIKSFSEQCYSTCSNTRREILLSPKWVDNSLVAKYSPLLLKFRTNLLFDQKEEIIDDLSRLIFEISAVECQQGKDQKVIRSMECIAKLFRVFCLDYGGQDILDAERIASELENEVLLAQVYRYAELLPNCSDQRKDELYQKGCSIFRHNKMEDHAIYCLNNMLVQQFYSDHVTPEQFRDMQVEAVNNVPGMVGLSHIYNNVGIAYLYCGHPTTAIEFFTKGLDYAKYQDRIVQNLALESNRMIAESYSFNTVDENRRRFLVRRIFDGMGMNKLPFLSADYILNILAIAYRQNPNFGNELLHTFPITQLVNRSFLTNIIGTGERILQMQYLASHYPSCYLLNQCEYPKIVSEPSGKRKEFIIRYGYSPFDFNTWL